VDLLRSRHFHARKDGYAVLLAESYGGEGVLGSVVVGEADNRKAGAEGGFDNLAGGVLKVGARGQNRVDVEVRAKSLKVQRSVPRMPMS
jgi:hypothetical protein